MRVLIEEALTTAETGFNILGSIPIAAIVSGAVRMVIGKVQVVAGAAFALYGLMYSFLAYKTDLTEIGVEHILHGCLNIGRGLTELLLGITFVGSFLLLFGQLVTNNVFTPQFAYTTQRR